MRRLLFLITVTLAAQNQWPPAGMRCPQRTLVVFDAGPNAAKSQELYPQHIAFLVRMMNSGKLVSAGPFTEGGAAAGAMVFATKDWSDIEAILKDEPFTRGGVMAVARHFVWTACEGAP